ncbi:MAG: DNA polymerase III subunit alpha [Bacteroidales bacterium]|nr:DNA polymerase III subunit alpha [Bacteroidales bacterium]
MPFVHLHCHTYYSILDGAASISSHFKKAAADGQPALAITDHGNMYGVKEFLKVAKDFPDVKPIIGCEVYVNPEGRFNKRGREDQGANHLILLAKNIQGYYNLVKLVSLGYTEGFYYKPKIDKELLEKYHENLICSSACLGGEIPQKILKGDIAGARESVQWYRNLFGEDYYLEVQLHKSEIPGYSEDTYPKQLEVNKVIFSLAQELGVKVIATNDVHFTSKEDGPAHDRLICLTTNKNFTDPNRLHYTQQEYLKTEEEMRALFPEHPEVIDNTIEVADKVEKYKIDRDHVLPIFTLPDGFTDSNDYLRHLCYQGAERLYPDMTDDIRERIDFELETIKNMGFPDYFLIVQDFINAARNIGVWVGPGRGSAAGSAVAYCLGITSVDPIKYNLLFERFLNPERISMPDIDIDFDDDGRGKVLQYVEQKYGKDHVSHVVTFGTMKAKSAIKDMARIEQVPLAESERLAKLVPDAFDPDIVTEKDNDGNEVKVEKKVKVNLKNCFERVPELKEALESSQIPNVSETLEYARKLEGTVRNTGVHACAVIIGRGNLTDYIPICLAKDKDSGEDMWVSQYEGQFIEDVGMLKMDFLGLKTLSILKEAVRNIKKHRGEDLDISRIPIDDRQTYELFGRGETIATFQFESEGMQMYLRQLKPSRFEDLIAMNALYRPGPIEYIPSFINRKLGTEKIEYDLPEMASILEDTYGVTVYQEQVMLLSQKLADFTKGQADGLRKAMGKKKLDKMMEYQQIFMEQGQKNGHPQNMLEKIWTDWKAFAEYAFNKSHATCYAWVGYQTGYLKAHYPAEFMAANLSSNLNNITELIKFMKECKRMGIAVLGPDVNESDLNFSVNKDGNIRFGMAGIKGMGYNSVEAIIKERENGPYKDLFDFIERTAGKGNMNRKALECLAHSGAFDSMNVKRDVFFAVAPDGGTFIDTLAAYSSKIAEDSFYAGNSLFGDDVTLKPVRPGIPETAPVNILEMLKVEKELVGIYISAHPLDLYRFEMDHFTTCPANKLAQMREDAATTPALQGATFMVGGLVTTVAKKMSLKGQPWAQFTLEDYAGSHEFRVFGKDYERYAPLLEAGQAVLLKIQLQPKNYTKNQDNSKKEDENKGPVECDIKIRNAMLLANARTDFLHSFEIHLPVEMINPVFRKEFVKALKANKGDKLLSIKVLSVKESIALDCFSRKYKTNASDELMNWLDSHKIRYEAVCDMNQF